MILILLVILILFALGSAPVWPYSAGWGYWPSSDLGLVAADKAFDKWVKEQEVKAARIGDKVPRLSVYVNAVY